MQELECESHSLGVEEDNAFNTRTLFAANRTSGVPGSTSSERGVPGASVGATASANPEETAVWADRASATGVSQQGLASGLKGVRWNGIGALTLVLMVSTFLGSQ